MVATKITISDLNQGEKLNEKNFDVWHCKILYLLEDEELIETITQSMIELE